MTARVFVFKEPYNFKSSGELQLFEYDDVDNVTKLCIRLLDGDGVREVNAYTVSGVVIFNGYKSKIKRNEKL